MTSPKTIYSVIDLLGSIIATFDNANDAHAFADTLVNYAYVEEVTQ